MSDPTLPGPPGLPEPEPDARTVPVKRREGLLWDGRYRLIRQIGRGGFGEVWLANDAQRNDQRVALKIIFAHAVDQVPDFATRFTSEILVLRALRVDGIPQIYNDGRTAAGEFFYTMELVDGDTLAQTLKAQANGQQKLDRAQACTILAHVADILHTSHARGVVHRDLKPANVMLQRQEHGLRVFVLDFGIAKVVQRNAANADVPTIASQVVIGSPPYMAPEQVRGENPTPATDVFALGVMLYELRTGAHPYRGGTDFEVAAARLHTDFRVPRDVALDPPCRELVESMLRLDPRERPAMADLRDRLRAIDATDVPSTPTRARVAGRAALVGAVVGLGGFGVWWSTREPTPPTDNTPSDNTSSDKTENVGPPGPARGTEVSFEQPAAGTRIGRKATVRGRLLGGVATSLRLGSTTLPVAEDGAFAGEVDAYAYAAAAPQRLAEATRDGAIALPAAVEKDGAWRSLEPVTFRCDFDPPRTEAIAPTDGACLASLRVLVEIRARDPSGVASVQANGSDLVAGDDDLYRGEVTLGGEGAATIRLDATDACGNVAAPVNLAVTVDTTKPSLTVDPARVAVVDTDVQVSGTCRDASLDTLTVDGASVTPDAEGKFTHGLRRKMTGTQTVELIALDRAGNRQTATLEVRFRARTELKLTQSAARTALLHTAREVEIVGSATQPLAAIEIGTAVAKIEPDGKTFRVTIPVQVGDNPVRITGKDTDDLAVTPLAVTFTVSPPPRVPVGCTAIGDAVVEGLATKIRHDASAEELTLVPHATKPFYIGTTEVTVGRFCAFRQRMRQDCDGALNDDRALTNVTLDDALAYCAGLGLRLPTYDEWVQAAGGPEPRRPYPWGSEHDAQKCVNRDMTPKPSGAQAVKSCPLDQTAEGVFDLAGNVREYVQSTVAAPRTCGSTWLQSTSTWRTGDPAATAPRGGRNNFTGFRVALDTSP